MSAATPSSVAFELKSAALPLVAVVLRTTDLGLLAAAFDARFGDGPALFDNDPVAIDLGPVREVAEPIDFRTLSALLRSHRMLPIAAKGGSAQQMEDALAAGLGEAHGTTARGLPGESEAVAAPVSTPLPSALPPVEAPPARTALVVDKPLRSGQRVYAKGADLIVLSVVSFGAEVIADGHIHVYAPLRGRALAGALGDTAARIFTTCLEPQLVSIAGIYRTAENDLAPEVRGRAAQVRLDGERLVVEPLVRD